MIASSMMRFSTAGVSDSLGMLTVCDATIPAVSEQPLDARLDVDDEAQQQHQQDDHDDQHDAAHAEHHLPQGVRVVGGDDHLPTAIFRRDRAMCRIRTAESLTLSTPSVRLVVCARTASTPASAVRAWSAIRAASARMIATMITTTTIAKNDSARPMYQSV